MCPRVFSRASPIDSRDVDDRIDGRHRRSSGRRPGAARRDLGLPEQNRDFYLLSLDLSEYAARVPSFHGLPTVTRDIIEGLYAKIIRQGVADGVFTVPDAAEGAATMRAFIEGTFLQWLQQTDWQESYCRYRDCCRDGPLALLGSSTG
jgi:hypothetical protein